MFALAIISGLETGFIIHGWFYYSRGCFEFHPPDGYRVDADLIILFRVKPGSDCSR